MNYNIKNFNQITDIDNIFDQMLDIDGDDVFNDIPKKLKIVYMWKTKDGNKIPISGMSEDHIKNCIKFLKNRQINNKIFIKEFKKELKKRK